MRIALVSDTYTPVAPAYPERGGGPDELRIPSVSFPPYPAVRLSLPARRRVFRFLVLAPLAQHALLVVLADHGGGRVVPRDHHHPHPANERIPLIFAGPGVARGRHLTRRLSLLDVPPTLLWSLGLEVPESYEGRVVREAFVPQHDAAVTA